MIETIDQDGWGDKGQDFMVRAVKRIMSLCIMCFIKLKRLWNNNTAAMATDQTSRMMIYLL